MLFNTLLMSIHYQMQLVPIYTMWFSTKMIP